MVDGLQQLAGDRLRKPVVGELGDVGLDRAARQLGDRLVDVAEDVQHDLDVVLLAKVFHQLRVDVFIVVEDIEVAAVALRLEAALDRLLEQGQGHRLVRARQRNAADRVIGQAEPGP